MHAPTITPPPPPPPPRSTTLQWKLLSVCLSVCLCNECRPNLRDIFNHAWPKPCHVQSQEEWRQARLTDQQWQELMCSHKNTDQSLIQTNPRSFEAASCMGLILEQSGGQNHNDISWAFSLDAEDRIITEEDKDEELEYFLNIHHVRRRSEGSLSCKSFTGLAYSVRKPQATLLSRSA